METVEAVGGIREHVVPRGIGLLRALVHSNLLVAMAATGVAVTTLGVLSLPVDPIPLAFVFVATLFGYTVNRFTDRAADAQNVPDRAAFVEAYGEPLLGIAGLGYLGGIAVTAAWWPSILPVALVPGIATALYATDAKRVFLVKNGLVGLTWACIPLGLGLYYGRPADPGILSMAAVIGALIGIAAVVFDIKDIAGDRAVGTRTLPVVVGPRSTRRLAAAATVCVIPLILIPAAIVSWRFLALLAYPAYLLAYLPFASTGRGALFYGLVVDGEHVAVGVLVALLWLA